MFKDYYLILGISPDSSLEEVKNAYKKQAFKWHPDKNPKSDTSLKMQEIYEGYIILKDVVARSRYDIEYKNYKDHFDTKTKDPK